MTKEYDVIHLNGKMHIGDKKLEKTTIDFITDGKVIKLPDNQFELDDDKWYSIVASTDPSLNLPLILPIIHDINPYKDICDKLGNPIDAMDSFLQLMKNKSTPEWKEANNLIEIMKEIVDEMRVKTISPKKYTEENMLKAIRMARYGESKVVPANNPDKEDKIERIYTYSDEEILQSFLPRKVEVEMEEVGAVLPDKPKGKGWIDIGSEGYAVLYQRPKVDKNNYIIVKRWII